MISKNTKNGEKNIFSAGPGIDRLDQEGNIEHGRLSPPLIRKEYLESKYNILNGFLSEVGEKEITYLDFESRILPEFLRIIGITSFNDDIPKEVKADDYFRAACRTFLRRFALEFPRQRDKFSEWIRMFSDD